MRRSDHLKRHRAVGGPAEHDRVVAVDEDSLDPALAGSALCWCAGVAAEFIGSLR
ncbi:hypothetical protein ACFU8Q_19775 [Streptomyces sp. NPDC057543]|uniref:hypothetical protein n=1 Tax=Streptomyces sp. NPDC057543 TaxID=3346163 RepID=UPI0036CD6B30